MKEEYKGLLQIPGYVVLIYLAYSFLTHGIGALQQSPGFIGLMTGVGIPLSIANWLIVVVGVLDLLVVIALFAYRNKWTLLYAGVWPLVPAFAGLIANGYFNIGYLQYTLMAAFAYWVFIEVQGKNSFFTKQGSIDGKKKSKKTK